MGNGTQVPALSIRHLSKTFAGMRALSDADLEVGAGEVHAVIGENGSGKSTLIKILAGYHRPDSGAEIMVCGYPLPPGAPEAAYALGCRFVHQDLGLVSESSVLDNLSFSSGFPTRLGSIQSKRAIKAAQSDLERAGLDIDPKTPVGQLAAAVQTGVAVARALRGDAAAPARLLVLDEPTATLPDNEVERLLGIVRRVAASGIGVIYVTHRLDEVFSVADTVTVLRDGALIATCPTSDLDRAGLIDLLLGQDVMGSYLKSEQLAHVAPSAGGKEKLLSVRGLTSELLYGVDLDASAGQIIGIAGITGSGRESILGAIFGATQRLAGEVRVAGQPIPAGQPHRARQNGVAYLPPDRKTAGGFMQLRAGENIMVSDLRGFTRFATIVKRSEQREVSHWMGKLDVSPPHSGRKILSTFSGGNQQKLLFCKWLRRKPSVFLLDEPTQGVDIGAKALLHRELQLAARAGMAVVVSSTDIDELVALCSEVIVLRNGRVEAVLTGSAITVGTISRAAIGRDAEVAA